MNLLRQIFLFFNFALYAQTPPYCSEEVLVACKEELIQSIENIDSFEEIKNELSMSSFVESMKHTAIIQLTENKSELLAPFPEAYIRQKDHKLYYYGLKKKVSKNKNAKGIHVSGCFKIDDQLKDQAEDIDQAFEDKRSKKANTENQLEILSNVFLGAVAAEKNLEQRPEINRQLLKRKKEVEYSRKIMLLAKQEF